jgi:glycosyltransferase involved in cell wall biosynthesis
MKLVSILIPTYNRVHLIEETVRSALSQTIDNIEVIVRDNCSTDGTFELAQKIAETDPRLKVFQNLRNVGPVQNWLLCADDCNAEFCKLLFSDDLIAPTYLQKTLPFLLDPSCGLVYTSAIIGSRPWEGNVLYRAFLDDVSISRNAFVRACLCTDGLIPVSPGAALLRSKDLKASILTKLEGVADYNFEQTGSGVDLLVYVLTALRYEKVQYVQEPLSFFRAHEGSLSVKNEGNEIVVGQHLAKQWARSLLKI